MTRLEELKEALTAAVGSEAYDEAAKLRDQLNELQLDAEVGVLQANTAFYEAFSLRDLKKMASMWLSHGEITCMHPGFPPLHGHGDILDSWREIFEGAEMKIAPESVRCTLLRGGRSAVVTCVERVCGPGDNTLTATNVFEKCADGRWHMVLHQAGPIVQKPR